MDKLRTLLNEYEKTRDKSYNGVFNQVIREEYTSWEMEDYAQRRAMKVLERRVDEELDRLIMESLGFDV